MVLVKLRCRRNTLPPSFNPKCLAVQTVHQQQTGLRLAHTAQSRGERCFSAARGAFEQAAVAAPDQETTGLQNRVAFISVPKAEAVRFDQLFRNVLFFYRRNFSEDFWPGGGPK